MDEDPRRLGRIAENLFSEFADQAGLQSTDILALRHVIDSSATLARQMDEAMGRGVLRRFAALKSDAHAIGEYDAEDRAVRIPLALLVEPALMAFVLGHEMQHALNSPAMDQATDRLAISLEHAARGTRNYTAAIEAGIKACRWDEASANLAGWNALADFLRRPDGHVQLDEILDSAGRVTSPFVDRVSIARRIDRTLTPNPDLTFNFSAANIEAMARRFFDSPPKASALGDLGTSDYTNYYGAWVVGAAVEEHNVHNLGQLMRIDLARLRLSANVMEENGLWLGVPIQRYVDRSTQPPTHGILHDTSIDSHSLRRSPQRAVRHENSHRDATTLAAGGIGRPASQTSPAGTRPSLARRRESASGRVRAIRPLGTDRRNLSDN